MLALSLGRSVDAKPIFRGDSEGGEIMKAPVLVVWSIMVMVGYALLPYSDIALAVALLVCGAGVVAWMISNDPTFWSEMRMILTGKTPF
jgi:hypothetical protein